MAEPTVDLALVLAMDCSGSVSNENHAIQLRGYALAIAHPAFIAAIAKTPLRGIALTFLQWAGANRSTQSIPWSVIDSAAAAQTFADRVLRLPNMQPDYTSISAAVDRAVRLLATGPIARHRTIDISGDGANNDGRSVLLARDEAVAAGITINGLPIVAGEPNIADYYTANVIGGPNAFIEVVRDLESFPIALLRKLTTEIVRRPTPSRA